ncbi:MAG TPA: hypothetical protein VF950_20815, partial [Planctomycetota bacterium]
MRLRMFLRACAAVALLPACGGEGGGGAAASFDIERVSLTSAGLEAAGGSCFINGYDVSADGRYVAFASSGSGLVADDRNQAYDVFVKDLQTGAIERVSVSSAGLEADGSSEAPSISADGRYVVFHSTATNLAVPDNDTAIEVFLRDRQLGTTECVTVAPGGGASTTGGMRPSISADGRYVAFLGGDDLAAGDADGRPDIL